MPTLTDVRDSIKFKPPPHVFSTDSSKAILRWSSSFFVRRWFRLWRFDFVIIYSSSLFSVSRNTTGRCVCVCVGGGGGGVSVCVGGGVRGNFNQIYSYVGYFSYAVVSCLAIAYPHISFFSVSRNTTWGLWGWGGGGRGEGKEGLNQSRVGRWVTSYIWHSTDVRAE